MRRSTESSRLCGFVGFKYLKEFGEPGGMGRPCGAGDKLTIDHSLGEFDLDECSSGQFNLGRASRIAVQLAALQHSRRSQQLGSVAKRSDRLIGFVEMTHDVEDLRIEAQIFRRASAGNDQCIVGGGIDLVEGCVQSEVVAAFFGVCLVALEVVNCGAHLLTFFLPGHTASTVWPTICKAWKGTMIS